MSKVYLGRLQDEMDPHATWQVPKDYIGQKGEESRVPYVNATRYGKRVCILEQVQTMARNQPVMGSKVKGADFMLDWTSITMRQHLSGCLQKAISSMAWVQLTYPAAVTSWNSLSSTPPIDPVSPSSSCAQYFLFFYCKTLWKRHETFCLHFLSSYSLFQTHSNQAFDSPIYRNCSCQGLPWAPYCST